MNVLVTGGAGFIGSHVVEALVDQGNTVTVLDNLYSGHMQNLKKVLPSNRVKFLKGDVLNPTHARKAVKGIKAVFHIAANPEVRLELADPQKCYEQNVRATYILLEAFRRTKAETLVFTSSSTVYGDAKKLPTPENYGPLKPISVYGASKLACEALISSYCYSFKRRGIVIRPANIVGSRSTHGVINDFVQKLAKDSAKLQIKGDGTQAKSYLLVDDCVKAILKAYESSDDMFSIFNVGSKDQATVKDIASIIIQEMSLKNTELEFTGGIDGGRGWVGDVKNMLLDITEMKKLGWRPTRSSKDAVRLAAKIKIKEFNQS